MKNPFKSLALWLFHKLGDWIISYAMKTPYFHLEGYMERYWVFRPRSWIPFNIRVHKVLRSDTGRHLHDHPWWNISIILRGAYDEVMPVNPIEIDKLPNGGEACYSVRRNEGAIVFRKAIDRHKLYLLSALEGKKQPVWSLFITGKKATWWGYYIPGLGKIHWKEYDIE